MSATFEPEESNPNSSKDEDIQGELHALQRTYDDFLDSSRMLEIELEKELSETENKLSKALEDKKDLASQLKCKSSQLDNVEQEIIAIKEKLDAESCLRVAAEVAQEKAETHTRNLEASLEIMKQECETAHERLACIDVELEEMKIDLEEERSRHQQQIEDLQIKADEAIRKLQEAEDKICSSKRKGDTDTTLAAEMKMDVEGNLLTSRLNMPCLTGDVMSNTNNINRITLVSEVEPGERDSWQNGNIDESKVGSNDYRNSANIIANRTVTNFINNDRPMGMLYTEWEPSVLQGQNVDSQELSCKGKYQEMDSRRNVDNHRNGDIESSILSSRNVSLSNIHSLTDSRDDFSNHVVSQNVFRQVKGLTVPQRKYLPKTEMRNIRCYPESSSSQNSKQNVNLYVGATNEDTHRYLTEVSSSSRGYSEVTKEKKMENIHGAIATIQNWECRSTQSKINCSTTNNGYLPAKIHSEAGKMFHFDRVNPDSLHLRLNQTLDNMDPLVRHQLISKWLSSVHESDVCALSSKNMSPPQSILLSENKTSASTVNTMAEENDPKPTNDNIFMQAPREDISDKNRSYDEDIELIEGLRIQEKNNFHNEMVKSKAGRSNDEIKRSQAYKKQVKENDDCSFGKDASGPRTKIRELMHVRSRRKLTISRSRTPEPELEHAGYGGLEKNNDMENIGKLEDAMRIGLRKVKGLQLETKNIRRRLRTIISNDDASNSSLADRTDHAKENSSNHCEKSPLNSRNAPNSTSRSMRIKKSLRANQREKRSALIKKQKSERHNITKNEMCEKEFVKKSSNNEKYTRHPLSVCADKSKQTPSKKTSTNSLMIRENTKEKKQKESLTPPTKPKPKRSEKISSFYKTNKYRRRLNMSPNLNKSMSLNPISVPSVNMTTHDDSNDDVRLRSRVMQKFYTKRKEAQGNNKIMSCP